MLKSSTPPWRHDSNQPASDKPGAVQGRDPLLPVKLPRWVLIQAIRRHWTIENGLYWVLDVTFREDDSRVRDRTAARNLAILRKIAINLISRSRTTRISMRGRRKQAAWNDEYMLSLLAG
jgi:hypothetical protein